MKKTLRLILGDQLNGGHTWFDRVDADVTYIMMEVAQETDCVTHHIQKVTAFFAAMRLFGERMRAAGHYVVYLRLDDPANRQSFEANVVALIREHRFARFECQAPDEYRLRVAFAQWTARLSVQVACTDSEHFLTDPDEFAALFAGRKRFLMENFYRHMRKKYKILLAGVAPSAVEAWYLGIYIDAVQWVELPNTLGMSQFADGGILATKPYVSSARYIQRMSDYCEDCSYRPAEALGAEACPFNALYWHFIDRHRERLRPIPRMGMMYRT